jgi:hypothetical protein
VVVAPGESPAFFLQGTGNREQGIGNREQGIGNREEGTGGSEEGIRDQVTGNGELQEKMSMRGNGIV